MTNNQNWFDQEFPKDSKEIEIEYEDFEGILAIEDYLNLTEITIADTNKIDKLILRNLSNLENLCITNCKLEKLIVENCPKTKEINVRSNSLDSLEFTKNLDKLETLEIDGNKEIVSGIEFLPNCLGKFSFKGTKLFRILEAHKQNWKEYKKNLEEKGISEAEKNQQELLSLREENEKLDKKYKILKENVGEVLTLLTSLKNKVANDPTTKEMVSNLERNVKEIVGENKKLKDELEEFRPLFDNEEPILEGSKLGKGGSGDVWLGNWKTQFVAVKKPINITNKNNLERVRNELKFLKNLRSKYTIQYYGEYRKESDFYIIMEYAENGSLDKFIQDNKDKPHNWKLNKRSILQMAKGLAYLHSEGVIHRDLKSPNVLLTKENVVKISDFGLSKVILDISEEHDYSESRPTISLRWVSPEVLEGKYSKNSDIYSLGVIIWEICAKSKPFAEINERTTIENRIKSGKTNDIPQDTPNGLKEIIENCWKMKANERIKIEEIILQLDIRDAETISYPFTFDLSQGTSASIINKELVLEKVNEIEKGLEEFKKSLKDESKELVDKFIIFKKQSLRNKKDEEVKNNVRKLEENLEERGITTQEIEKLTKNCEELAILEQQLQDQEQLRANVEMPT